MSEDNLDKLDFSGMASTELPGRGEFFLYNDVSRDKKYGSHGGVWVVGAEAAGKLAESGIDAVLENPESKESAALFMVVEEKEGDKPGREMLHAVIQARASDLGENPGNSTMSITNVFFDEVDNPERVIQNVFDGYDYQIIGRSDALNSVNIEISLPLKQFS